MERYVIIGGGIAATEAAAAIRTRHTDADITLLAEEARPFYIRPLLADFVARRIPESHLWRNYEAEAHEKHITLITGHPVVAIDRAAHTVSLSDGQAISYEMLLIATGVKPQLPDIPGKGLQGVTPFSTYADAVRIIEWIEVSERAVVVGRGLQGVELARALKLSGLAVTLIVPDESPWFPSLYQVKGDVIEAALAQYGVEVISQDAPAELVGHAGDRHHVHTVRTREGREIPADIVGFAVAQRPRVDFLVGSGISLADGVVTDLHLRSTDPTIFAAGDVAQVEVNERRLPIGYGWMRARLHGDIAGRNMTGASVAVETGDEDEAQSLYGRRLLARWE